MELTAALIDELVHRARDASRHAYAPYSRFHVGAAVLADGSAIHTGANVENASYGLSICAERSAIFRAIGEGTEHRSRRRLHADTAARDTVRRVPPGPRGVRPTCARHMLHE